jgi:glutamate synthase (NADPH/NADH) small chain
VVLATGATVPRDLALEGRGLKGIHHAMPYLKAATKAHLTGVPVPDDLSAHGKHVIVIGAGDTGTDCTATAVRQVRCRRTGPWAATAQMKS